MTSLRLPRNHRVAVAALALRLALPAGVAAATAAAVDYEDGRATSGARIFRAMLAADTEIEGKTGPGGALRLLVVHASDAERARAVAEVIARRDAARTPEPLRGLSVRVEVMALSALVAGGHDAAGIFVAQPLGRDEIAALVRHAVEHRVLVYSPFEGDVERGIPGGLSIEAQVRPMVNTQTLQAAGLVLKGFFLKVAKVYP